MAVKDPYFAQMLSEGIGMAHSFVVAAFAAGLRYLISLKTKWSEFNGLNFTLAVVVGGFNGYLVFLFCLAIDMPWPLVGFVVGGAGALGNELLSMLANKARSTMGLERRKSK